jgi:hypothetical protein
VCHKAAVLDPVSAFWAQNTRFSTFWKERGLHTSVANMGDPGRFEALAVEKNLHCEKTSAPRKEVLE